MPETQEQTGAHGIPTAIALFVSGFLLIAFLLHLTLRNPLYLHADMRSEKLDIFNHLRGSVFSAAFGSSHVHNGFDPRVFDRELSASSPVRTHTFNLAVEGGSQSEERALALEFVRHMPTPPPGESCIVLLELNAGANFLQGYLVHPRTIDIYDWQMARFIHRLTGPGMPLGQRIGRTGFALTAAALHYLNVGMLSNKVFAPPLDPELLDINERNDQRGLMALGPGDDRLGAELATWRRPRPARDPGQALPGNLDLLHELESASPRHQLAFVYFVYPKFSDLTAVPDFPEHLLLNGREVPIINLARPDRFPQFYQLRLWHDDAHLNSDGAAVVTDVLADELKKWYAGHGGAPTCAR